MVQAREQQQEAGKQRPVGGPGAAFEPALLGGSDDAFASPEQAGRSFDTAGAGAFLASTASSALGLAAGGLGIQAKLEVGSSDDPLENEADAVAEKVVRMSIGEPPSDLGDSLLKDEKKLVRPKLSATSPLVQRQAAPATPSPAPAQTPAPAATAPTTVPDKTKTPGLVVDDSATVLAPGQLRKSAFMTRLKAAIQATAEAALAPTGRTAADCPWIAFYFALYEGKSAAHIEQAILKYTPGAASARTAEEYIPFITARIRQSVEVWATTGEVTGVPEGAAGMSSAGGGGILSTIASGVSAVGNFFGSLFRKDNAGGGREAGSPLAIQSQLGAGTPLEAGVRGRMEPAFGTSLAGVRVHTDATAAGLSSELNARAFTVGEHIAFGAGEYRPGSIVGDALVAHELSHALQQKSGSSRLYSSANTGVERSEQGNYLKLQRCAIFRNIELNEPEVSKDQYFNAAIHSMRDSRNAVKRNTSQWLDGEIDPYWKSDLNQVPDSPISPRNEYDPQRGTRCWFADVPREQCQFSFMNPSTETLYFVPGREGEDDSRAVFPVDDSNIGQAFPWLDIIVFDENESALRRLPPNNEELEKAMIHEVNHVINNDYSSEETRLEGQELSELDREHLARYRSEFRAYWVSHCEDESTDEEKAAEARRLVFRAEPDIEEWYKSAPPSIRALVDGYLSPEGNITNAPE